MKFTWRIGAIVGGSLAAVVGLVFLIMALLHRPDQDRSVGVILPLTGDAAAYGKSMQRGMDLALGQINAAASSPLKLRYEDSQADPKAALSAYRKLVDLHHVPAVLGPFTSSETFAVAPVAERDKVVILSTGASAPGITTAGDYIFRIVTSDLYDGDVVARFAKQKLSLNKIALVYINNDYGVGVRDAFSRRFKELGGDVVLAEGYPASDSDQRTLLAKVKGSGAGALFLVGYKEMGKILKQTRELGITVPVLSTGLFEDPEILATAGDAAEGVYYSYATFDPSSNDPAVREFAAAFRKKYGSDPDILAALGYDAVRIMARAFPDSAVRGDQVRDLLYRIKDFRGATGDMSFDENGDVTKSFGIKRVQSGKFTWVVDRF